MIPASKAAVFPILINNSLLSPNIPGRLLITSFKSKSFCRVYSSTIGRACRVLSIGSIPPCRRQAQGFSSLPSIAVPYLGWQLSNVRYGSSAIALQRRHLERSSHIFQCRISSVTVATPDDPAALSQLSDHPVRCLFSACPLSTSSTSGRTPHRRSFQRLAHPRDGEIERRRGVEQREGAVEREDAMAVDHRQQGARQYRRLGVPGRG
jgi:hypothetical protein